MMKESDMWLSQVSVFQTSESEIHIYLGNEKEPRSSLLIIRGKRIASPIRVPPISKSALTQRYNKKEIDLSQLYPQTMIIFGILQIVDIQLMEEIEEYQENRIQVIPWEKFNQLKNTDGLLPYTKEISSLIDNPEQNMNLLNSIIFLLGEPDRNIRQQSLTKLVQLGTPTMKSLLYYLFRIRPEMTIAIIRELGRHGIKLDFVMAQCFNLLQSMDKGFVRFSAAYIYQFDVKKLKKTMYWKNRELAIKQYQIQSDRKRITSLLNPLKEMTNQSAGALNVFELLQEDDDLFTFEARLLIDRISKISLDPIAIRSACMDLIQFAETSQSPDLLAFVLSLVSVHDHIVGEDTINYISKLNSNQRYIRNRLLSQLHVWNRISDETSIIQFVSKFLQIFPPITIEQSNKVSKIINSWYQHHPILQIVQNHYRSALEQSNTLLNGMVHLINYPNQLLSGIINHSIDKIDVTPNSLIQKLAIVGNYPDSIDTVKLISGGTILSEEDLQFISININLLDILRKASILVTTTLFRDIIKTLHNQNISDFTIVQNFIKMVAATDKSLLDSYFNQICDLCIEKFDEESSQVKLKQLIISVIIPWGELTNTFPNEKIQNRIDAFKIIYEEDIDNFDLENSKPLAVETISLCYSLTGGKIPKFIEGNIQFSFTKPVWDQLARHYLALGISRPNREAFIKSKLKEVPNYLTRDVLGQIALVNQTLSYCERNGFRKSLENLIITNMYRRGWNVERGLERTLPSLIGSVSPRLRSYIAAYLIVDQGEISLDMLKWARDVEDYLIRDRIIRELERYGTADMWVVLANSYHDDISNRAIKELIDTRMSATARSQTTIQLLKSSRKEVREVGLEWLINHGVQQEHIRSLFYLKHSNVLYKVVSYILDNVQHLKEEHQKPLFDLIFTNMWRPRLPKKVRELIVDLSAFLKDKKLRNTLSKSSKQLAGAKVNSRIVDAVSLLNKLEGDK